MDFTSSSHRWALPCGVTVDLNMTIAWVLWSTTNNNNNTGCFLPRFTNARLAHCYSKPSIFIEGFEWMQVSAAVLTMCHVSTLRCWIYSFSYRNVNVVIARRTVGQSRGAHRGKPRWRTSNGTVPLFRVTRLCWATLHLALPYISLPFSERVYKLVWPQTYFLSNHLLLYSVLHRLHLITSVCLC